MTSSVKQEQVGEELLWQSADSARPPVLEKEELHLWYLPLTLDESRHETALGLLNDTQRDKYYRRATPALQQSYLAGRYHLMTLLAGYNSLNSEDVQISYSRLNKPYLNPNPLDIQFNFTDTVPNSGNAEIGVALLAFARSRTVGVDIESLKRRSNFAAIVAKRFSRAETDYVTDVDRGINARRFLAYWTRKEAYGKATGQGINFKMRDIDLASPSRFQLPFKSDDQAYRLQQVQIGEDLIAAVVHQGHQELAIKAFNCKNHLP